MVQADQKDIDFDQQIDQHLEGQYEWSLSVPVSQEGADHNSTQEGNVKSMKAETEIVFGCNLLAKKTPSAAPSQANNDTSLAKTELYTLIATPLLGNSIELPIRSRKLECSKANETDTVKQHDPSSSVNLATITNIEAADDTALSPAVRGERLVRFHTRWPRVNSPGSPRIEDSLEEIDQLEEQLEALNEVAVSKRVAASLQRTRSRAQTTAKNSASNFTTGRQPPTLKGLATLRLKSTQGTRPSLRRSASPNSRGNDSQQVEVSNVQPEQKAAGGLCLARGLSTLRTVASSPSTRSSKAPTKPQFELPGEAVARRLKEQREARLARQAEVRSVGAPQTSAASFRHRSSKPLTKPMFELPGEAISRRRKEEREIKLREQEEEERKRREFKARPVQGGGLFPLLPRDTVTSRTRQGKPVLQKEDPAEEWAARPKRFSLGSVPMSSNRSLVVRGRNSIILPINDASRGTSISTTSANAKRMSLSVEDMLEQRIRGKELFTKENTFVQNQESERRTRQSVTKSARNEAAERSRAASREWAEKKRQKELALRQIAVAAVQHVSE